MPSFRSTSQAGSYFAAGLTSFTCPIPAGTIAGDMLIACQAEFGSTPFSTLTITGGSTWQLLVQQVWGLSGIDANSGSKIWWKIAGPSEPASYTVTKNVNGTSNVGIVSIQNPGPGTPIYAASGVPGDATSISTPSTTPAENNNFELRFAVADSTNGSLPISWTPPVELTERFEASVANGSFRYVPMTAATRTLTSNAATGVLVFTPFKTSDGSTVVLQHSHGYTINIPPGPRFIGWGQPL